MDPAKLTAEDLATKIRPGWCVRSDVQSMYLATLVRRLETVDLLGTALDALLEAYRGAMTEYDFPENRGGPWTPERGYPVGTPDQAALAAIAALAVSARGEAEPGKAPFFAVLHTSQIDDVMGISEFTHADLVSRLPGIKKREFAAQTVHNALIELDGNFLISRKDPERANRVLYRMV